MAQKRSGGKYFTTRTEIDLDCCKQMSAHNVARENTMYMLCLVLATLFILFEVFWPDAKRWPGLFAIVVAAAWFWKTRSAGTKLWMQRVNPTGLDYLIRDISINRDGIIEHEQETGEINKYSFSEVDNIARSKSYIMIIMTNGFILPFEVANMEGGSPDSLMSVLARACPRLAGGPRSTGAGIFITCAVLTAIDLFAWIGLIALCILHQ